MLFVALTLDFPGGLAHWFSLVHIPYRCERSAEPTVSCQQLVLVQCRLDAEFILWGHTHST